MEFLYKLYDHEYFGIGLFIVITVLTLLFLLILFFGKKDEKQRKLEETNKLELETNAFKESNEVISDLSVPEIEQPILQPVEPVQTFANEIIDIPVIEKTVEIPVVSENIEPMSNDINKDDSTLNMADVNVSVEEIAPVMESPVVLEEPKVEESIIDSIDVNSLFQTNLENISEVEKVNSVEEVALELPEISNLDEVEINPFIIEDTPVEETVSPVVEETSISEEPKKVENPFELPKLNQDNNSNNNERISDFDSLFGNIESETYNLKK